MISGSPADAGNDQTLADKQMFNGFLREQMIKMISKIFSWEFIVVFYITLAAVFLLSGCAARLSATVGDHTVHTGFHLTHKESSTND